MKSPRSKGLVTSDAETTPEEEVHRLHRDPAAVEGLSPGKRRDHDPASQSEQRSSTGSKPYTTESETYRDGPARRPDDPVERAEAKVPPRR